MRERPILLDTCAAIWLDGASTFSAEAEAALQGAQSVGTPVYMSPITAWEVGMLVSKDRLVLTLPPLRWFESILDLGVELAVLTPEILVESTQLSGRVLRDPSDRIIAATARILGYRLMTRDRPLLDFAAAGHVVAIAC